MLGPDAQVASRQTSAVSHTEHSYLVLEDQVEHALNEVADGLDDLLDWQEALPENTPLSLPSNQDIQELKAQGLGYLVEQEITL